MVKKLACGMVTALAMVCAAHADEERKAQAVKLSDAELDKITAGSVTGIHVVVNPGNGNHTNQNKNHTIIILGTGTGGGGANSLVLIQTRNHAVSHIRF